METVNAQMVSYNVTKLWRGTTHKAKQVILDLLSKLPKNVRSVEPPIVQKRLSFLPRQISKKSMKF